MPEPLTNQQSEEDIDALLLCSIKRYEDILTLFTAINHDLNDNNPATLDTRVTEILQLQDTAALADHALAAIMQEMAPVAATHPLMDRRQNLMHQILIHNRSLCSTIDNIKSLLVHEIKEMQSGQAALHGYRQAPPAQNGGILNGSL